MSNSEIIIHIERSVLSTVIDSSKKNIDVHTFLLKQLFSGIGPE